MKNIKKILSLISAVTLTTCAATSTVACNYQTSIPNLNYKYGVLLKLYDENSAMSLLQQELKYEGDEYFITVDEEIINRISFRECLLLNGKAKNSIAKDFLKELGFTSGSVRKPYSETDFFAILKLTAKVINNHLSTISVKNDNSDFQVYNSSCQIDIMNGDELVKPYIINTKYSDLKISDELINNVGLYDLKLSILEGFKVGWPIANFQLKFQSENRQKRFNVLVKILNANIILKFYNKSDKGKELTGNFENSKVYLQILFDSVAITNRIDCSKPPID